MFEMLVQRSNPVTPLTPMSTPPGAHNGHSDISPRSSNSSFGSSDGVLHHASLPSPNNDRSPQEFSALQKLQFALARDDLFSAMLKNPDKEPGPRLVKQCQSSSSSSIPTSPEAMDDHELLTPSPNGMKTLLPTTSPNDANSSNIFECPLCAVVCNSRHDFNEHLVTHSQQFACPRCTFFTDEESKLREHVVEAHDTDNLDGLTDEEVRTPKTNSQGKMKTFKCKQCGYHAVTKMDFWEHTKGHIRQEKMLTCPKCPFVTEYKHHLEYHLRNHFGSKPFQCTKCAYSCVNKSMLNSHLKSHSNVYQYRCADCSYATKYCHSLKLHLRKYDHKPSMVLNPDGTPNPLPIIDVYGTRRGPKIKRSSETDSVDMGSTAMSPVTPKDKPHKTHQKTPRRAKTTDGMDKQAVTNNNHNREATPPKSPHMISRPEYAFSPTTPLNHHSPPNRQLADMKPFAVEQPEVSPHHHHHLNLLRQQQQQQQQQQQFPRGLSPNISTGMVNPAAIQSLLMQNSANGMNPVAAAAALQNILMQNSGLMGKSPMEIYAAALNQYIMANNQVNQVMNLSTAVDMAKIANEQRSRLMCQLMQQSPNNVTLSSGSPPIPSRRSPTPPSEIKYEPEDALDLRNPKRTAENTESQQDDANKKRKERKRKGKALRYINETNDVLNNNVDIQSANISSQDVETSICKYCDIAFPQVLYALHMRFHSGDTDPFRCNVCGANSTDKVSFFVHLATASH